eukprot:729552-Rhodomonas_salina.1
MDSNGKLQGDPGYRNPDIRVAIQPLSRNPCYSCLNAGVVDADRGRAADDQRGVGRRAADRRGQGRALRACQQHRPPPHAGPRCPLAGAPRGVGADRVRSSVRTGRRTTCRRSGIWPSPEPAPRPCTSRTASMCLARSYSRSLWAPGVGFVCFALGAQASAAVDGVPAVEHGGERGRHLGRALRPDAPRDGPPGRPPPTLPLLPPLFSAAPASSRVSAHRECRDHDTASGMLRGVGGRPGGSTGWCRHGGRRAADSRDTDSRDRPTTPPPTPTPARPRRPRCTTRTR